MVGICQKYCKSSAMIQIVDKNPIEHTYDNYLCHALPKHYSNIWEPKGKIMQSAIVVFSIILTPKQQNID